MLVLPKIRIQKGLPFGVDVGAMYSYLPGSNIKLFGAEVSYAILEGSVATPALKVRGTYTKLTGVNDLAFQTSGIDASISKGFLLLTPYAGAGMVRIDSKPQGDLQRLSTLAGSPLTEEKIWQSRYFVGLKISPMPLFGVTAEVEYSKRPAYSLKAAISSNRIEYRILKKQGSWIVNNSVHSFKASFISSPYCTSFKSLYLRP